MSDQLVAALSCDERYCRIMAITILSLLENNRSFKNVKVYSLLHNVSENSIKSLEEIFNRYNRDIEILDISKYCDNYRFWERQEDSRYVRLLLSEIIPEEKVLYLDCDIMIRKDLHQLWNINLDGYAQAAVLDTVRPDARAEAHVSKDSNYFNSGVLLINLTYWRNNNVLQSFKEFKMNNNNRGIYRDQRVLNGTLSKSTLIISPRYNIMPEFYQFSVMQIKEITGMVTFYDEAEINQSCYDPYIVHFAGRSIDRPWYTNCVHPFMNEYRSIMERTSFTNFPLWKDTRLNIIKWRLKRIMPFRIYQLIRKRN